MKNYQLKTKSKYISKIGQSCFINQQSNQPDHQQNFRQLSSCQDRLHSILESVRLHEKQDNRSFKYSFADLQNKTQTSSQYSGFDSKKCLQLKQKMFKQQNSITNRYNSKQRPLQNYKKSLSKIKSADNLVNNMKISNIAINHKYQGLNQNSIHSTKRTSKLCFTIDEHKKSIYLLQQKLNKMVHNLSNHHHKDQSIQYSYNDKLLQFNQKDKSVQYKKNRQKFKASQFLHPSNKSLLQVSINENKNSFHVIQPISNSSSITNLRQGNLSVNSADQKINNVNSSNNNFQKTFNTYNDMKYFKQPRKRQIQMKKQIQIKKQMQMNKTGFMQMNKAGIMQINKTGIIQLNKTGFERQKRKHIQQQIINNEKSLRSRKESYIIGKSQILQSFGQTPPNESQLKYRNHQLSTIQDTNYKKNPVHQHTSSTLSIKNHLKQTTSTSSSSKLSSATIDCFVHIKQIGKGKFGNVYLSLHKQTNFLCAIKVIRKQLIRKQRNLEQLTRQIKLQSYLQHVNSVKMYAFFNDQNNIYLIMEYCHQGQLYHYLKEQERLTQKVAVPIIKDICMGIKHLHDKNIIHRDIKPQNIVMSFSMSKICDFGWSVNMKDQKRNTFCGTPLYVSPQLLLGKNYDYKVDIWALGILTYQILTGQLPFNITNQNELKKIITSKANYPKYLSQNAVNFIQHLLQKNPNSRLDIKTILTHNFLNQTL